MEFLTLVSTPQSAPPSFLAFPETFMCLSQDLLIDTVCFKRHERINTSSIVVSAVPKVQRRVLHSLEFTEMNKT